MFQCICFLIYKFLCLFSAGVVCSSPQAIWSFLFYEHSSSLYRRHYSSKSNVRRLGFLLFKHFLLVDYRANCKQADLPTKSGFRTVLWPMISYMPTARPKFRYPFLAGAVERVNTITVYISYDNGVVAWLRGNWARRRHFLFVRVALCAWADGEISNKVKI